MLMHNWSANGNRFEYSRGHSYWTIKMLAVGLHKNISVVQRLLLHPKFDSECDQFGKWTFLKQFWYFFKSTLSIWPMVYGDWQVVVDLGVLGSLRPGNWCDWRTHLKKRTTAWLHPVCRIPYLHLTNIKYSLCINKINDQVF